MLSFSGVSSYDFYSNVCSACAATVVIFEFKSFSLLTYLLTYHAVPTDLCSLCNNQQTTEYLVDVMYLFIFTSFMLNYTIQIFILKIVF